MEGKFYVGYLEVHKIYAGFTAYLLLSLIPKLLGMGMRLVCTLLGKSVVSFSDLWYGTRIRSLPRVWE